MVHKENNNKERINTLTKLVVRTSDRINFKSCRQAWDYGSKTRRNFEPISLPKPLDFGTAFHAGAEVLYDPRTWHLMSQEGMRDTLLAASLQTFAETNRSALLRFEEHMGSNEEVREDFAERHELGLGMINNYYQWMVQIKEWERFTPTHVEIEFEVPIPWAFAQDTYGKFFKGTDGNTYHVDQLGTPVFYQGRIDSIWQDMDGRYWIVDHKTCAQMRADVIAFLEMDEQMKSYGWAIQKQLGIPIAGIIYNEVYKSFPQPPAENKVVRQGRSFSVNKQIDSTYHLYKQTVMEHDRAAYDQGLYNEILEHLINSGNKFIRRSQVSYSDFEYEQLGFQICLEAIDMYGDPLIYPNPSRFKCGYCMFRKPCLARMDGSDEEFILRQLYTEREKRLTESPFEQDPR